MTPRRIGDDVRSDDVVAHSLKRMRLHHGHVLVGGGVEHRIDAESPEDLIHPGPVTDIGYLRNEIDLRKCLFDFQIDPVQVAFGFVDPDDLLRIVAGDLTAKLGSDRTGGPGNQDDPAANRLG